MLLKPLIYMGRNGNDGGVQFTAVPPIIRQFKIFEELGSWSKSKDRLGSIWLTLYDKESGDFSSDGGVAYLRFLPLDSLSPDVPSEDIATRPQ